MKHTLDGQALVIAGPQSSSLAAILALPKGTPPLNGWPVVAAFHGLTLSRDFFYDLALPLNEAGIALLGVDFRGHGRSTGLLQDTTLAAQTQDVLAVLQWLANSELSKKNLYFLAFSMGSVPVLQALQQGGGPTPAALALWAPLLNTVEWAQRRLSGYQRIGNGMLEFWNHQIVSTALFDSAQAMEPMKFAQAWSGPLFLAHADQDKNQLPAGSHSLAARRRAQDLPVEAWFPPLSGHFFAASGERQELLKRTVSFFQSCLH